MIHELRIIMENNKYLKGIVPKIKNTKIMKYRSEKIHQNERKKNFKRFYKEHENDFNKLYDLLEDDLSKKTMNCIIKYRLTLNKKYLSNIVVKPQYFQKDIIKPLKDEVFIDAGAYIGDTIEELSNFGGKNYWKKVYAIEPDEFNREKLKKNIKKYKNIEILPIVLWSKKTKMYFGMYSSFCSRINLKEKNLKTKLVSTNSIDNICKNDHVTFIKMDVEGAEKEALLGGIKTIKRDKPRLAICLYHNLEDLYEIPFFIHDNFPWYKLYIRHHKDDVHETVLYCV